jgi:hypothetical protein
LIESTDIIEENYEEEDEVKPIISVDSIKRVVSMSQSFTGSQGSQPQGEFSSIISVDSNFKNTVWLLLTVNLVMTWVRFIVLNATFNNISAITWRSVLMVEETGVPRENHRPAARH